MRFALLTIACLAATASVLPSAPQLQPVSSGVYTADQAKRGEAAYQKSCSVCRMEDLSGDQFAAPLIGQTFSQRWQDAKSAGIVPFTIVKISPTLAISSTAKACS